MPNSPSMLAVSDEFRLVGLLLVLLLACIGGLAVVLWVRKWVKDEAPVTRHEGGFTLSDLRALHKEGKISNDEYERAREKIVAHARRSMLAPDADPPAAASRMPTPSAQSPPLPDSPDGPPPTG